MLTQSMRRFTRHHDSNGRRSRGGSILVLATCFLVLILVLASFSIDVGYIALTKTQLQNAADAAARASVMELPASSRAELDTIAQQYAQLNEGDGVLLNADIELGEWDDSTATFTGVASVDDASAVRVTVRRSAATGNPLGLFFAPIFGHTHTDLTASATATSASGDCFTSFGVIAGNKLQIGEDSTLDGICVYGRQRVEIGGGGQLRNGTKIGSLPSSVIQCEMSGWPGQYEYRGDKRPDLADSVSSLIDDIQAGINLPDKIKKVKVIGSWPPPNGVKNRRAYVVNGNVNLPNESTLSVKDVIIAARGDIKFGEKSILVSNGVAGTDFNTVLIAEDDIQIGEKAGASRVDMIAGHDIQIGEKLEAFSIGIMQAGHDIQLGEGPTLSTLDSEFSSQVGSSSLVE